jgi:hypothetical protein
MLRLPFFLIFVITMLVYCNNAAALSCDGKLVEAGDTKLDVINRCGEPTWKEVWDEELIEGFADKRLEHRTYLPYEEWTYNFGPNRLIYYLVFRGSYLEYIDTGDRGFTPQPNQNKVCGPNDFRIGLTKLELLDKCGKPDWRERYPQDVVVWLDDILRRRRLMMVEEWTYNLGPHTFQRILVLERGKVVEIKTGERGY